MVPGERAPVSGGEPPSRVEVVALVTSAGGLEALSAVLRSLPEGFPAAIVVEQHLGGQGSQLVDILGRRTALPVAWAQDGAPLAAGAVTVAPPRSLLEILPDRTCSVRRTDPGQRLERPLDALLTSVGDSVGAHAVAVVLTGMGNDGAAGAGVVHEAGGVVIAQSEDTAEQPSMPHAAVGADAVDLVLPLHGIGTVLVDLVDGRSLPRPAREDDAIRLTFGGSGLVAGLAQEIDWAATPLGAVSGWPEAMRVATRMAMESSHGVALLMGEREIVIVNDAAIRVLGEQLPRIFGMPHAEAFPENREYLVPVLARVRDGEPVLHPAQLTPFMREGQLQYAWFDLSYTAVRASDGSFLALQQTFLERTDEVLDRRRLQTLNRLAALPTASGRAGAMAAAVEVLAGTDDVPFAAAYLVDGPRTHASLTAATGVDAGSPMAPHQMRLSPGAPWPLHEAVQANEQIVLTDVADRFRGQVVGDERLVLEQVLLHPLRSDTQDAITGILVLGAHPLLPLDEGYRQFLATVGETVAAKLNEAQARQRERHRLEQLAELDRAKTDFFSNISHEFRTPLTLMLGPLEALAEQWDHSDTMRRADLELVVRNARRLERMVDTMLDFAQVEAGRLRARFAPVDLTERTRELVAQFDSAASRAGIGLRVELEELPEAVWVDAEMWEKIVSNLLSNALKFTFDGQIAVTLQALPKHAELVVADTGVGIPEDELPQVFKRFHRVGGTRARTHEGTGIGLALVDELVRRHRGRIRAESTVGKGTTFTVWIPLGPPARGTDAPPPASPPSAVASAMAEEARGWVEEPEPLVAGDGRGTRGYAPGARVLVADDNRDMRDYLTRLLLPHWTVETVADGAAALEHARRNPPDLVLTDVMMPELDGFGLLHALRQDPELSAVPVVLVTARAGQEAAIDGLLAGANDYIVKPFAARELVARVAGQLELARARQHAPRPAPSDPPRTADRSVPDQSG